MKLLENIKSKLADIVQPFGESKVKHDIHLEIEGHKVFLVLDVSGHTIKERLSRHIFMSENERMMMSYVNAATKKLAMKAMRKGLLTNSD